MSSITPEEQELLDSHPEFAFSAQLVEEEIAIADAAYKRGEDSVWKLFEDAYPELTASLKKSM